MKRTLRRYSGPTIHFVDEEYDTGQILAQSAVHVNANDTPEELAKRVLHEVLLRILLNITFHYSEN